MVASGSIYKPRQVVTSILRGSRLVLGSRLVPLTAFGWLTTCDTWSELDKATPQGGSIAHFVIPRSDVGSSRVERNRPVLDVAAVNSVGMPQ